MNNCLFQGEFAKSGREEHLLKCTDTNIVIKDHENEVSMTLERESNKDLITAPKEIDYKLLDKEFRIIP